MRLGRAAWAFTTRRVARDSVTRILRDARAPGPGDMVLARVDEIGYHSGLQLPDGRRKTLFPGDEIVVAYGNRYAPSQFEAVVPQTLGPCHLVASGGVASKALSWHVKASKGPTRITPVGLLAGNNSEPANLRDYALQPVDRLPGIRPGIVAVVGTVMDSGKTQAATSLARGLKLAGLRAGYAKVTGTGAGGDTWLATDAGANPVLDFTDAGLVSTYLAPAELLERVFVTLMAHMARARVDAIVVEVADGVLQAETAALLTSACFRDAVHGLIFTSSDAMGALAGTTWLRDRGLPVIGLSGVLTSSPLQIQEAARETGLPVWSRADLARPKTAVRLFAGAQDPAADAMPGMA